jgi:hypothetical protein
MATCRLNKESARGQRQNEPPSGPLDVGTYGVVTRNGNFLPHDNIYFDKFKASYKPDATILAPAGI